MAWDATAYIESIPEYGKQFLRWLRATRAKLDRNYLFDKLNEDELSESMAIYRAESRNANLRMVAEESDNYEVIEAEPINGVYGGSEWTWEMELDALGFYINNRPFFRLDHRPPLDVFTLYLGYNHYGHFDCSADTPDEYRYIPQCEPPAASTKDLEFYDAHKAPVPIKSPHELLAIREALTPLERVRTVLLQAIVGNALMSTEGDLILSSGWRSTCADRKNLPRDVVRSSMFLLDVALSPPIFRTRVIRERVHGTDLDLIWLRADTCAWIAVQLNDTHTMKAAVAKLVSEVLWSKNLKEGHVFGVVLSLAHIVLVSIDTCPGIFEHTPASQFLPSAFATSPSTPGIEALARLACRPDLSFAWGMVANSNLADPGLYGRGRQGTVAGVRSKRINLATAPILSRSGSVVQRLPNEIWHTIADLVLSARDLVSLAKVSHQCRGAAAAAIRWPRISNAAFNDPRSVPGSTSTGPPLLDPHLIRWTHIADVLLRKPVEGPLQFLEGVEECRPAFSSLCVSSFEVDAASKGGKINPKMITLWGTRVYLSSQTSVEKAKFRLDGILHVKDGPFDELRYALI